MEDRLVIIRIDGVVGSVDLSRAAGRLSGDESTIWDAHPAQGGSSARLVPVDADPIPEDVSGVLIDISRALSGGESGKLSDILSGFVASAGVEEHERG
jgi:hypothetical protein